MIVSNFVLNSTETHVQVTPWPLAPAPVMVNRTNTSIAVMVVLADMTKYEPITYVAAKVKKTQHNKYNNIIMVVREPVVNGF